MEEVYEFLKKCGIYYLATADGDQPRVRPFGTQDIFEGKLYIQTGKSKAVSRQIQATRTWRSAASRKGHGCGWPGSWCGTTGSRRNGICWTPIRS